MRRLERSSRPTTLRRTSQSMLATPSVSSICVPESECSRSQSTGKCAAPKWCALNSTRSMSPSGSVSCRRQHGFTPMCVLIRWITLAALLALSAIRRSGALEQPRKKKTGYTGAELEFRIIEVASNCADRGVFILPQGSCPFMYSGRQSFAAQRSAKYERFNEQTGIAFELGCAIDTAEYRRDWKGVAPICEIVIADFPIPEKVSPQFPQQPLVFA